MHFWPPSTFGVWIEAIKKRTLCIRFVKMPLYKSLYIHGIEWKIRIFMDFVILAFFKSMKLYFFHEFKAHIMNHILWSTATVRWISPEIVWFSSLHPLEVDRALGSTASKLPTPVLSFLKRALKGSHQYVATRGLWRRPACAERPRLPWRHVSARNVCWHIVVTRRMCRRWPEAATRSYKNASLAYTHGLCRKSVLRIRHAYVCA